MSLHCLALVCLNLASLFLEPQTTSSEHIIVFTEPFILCLTFHNQQPAHAVQCNAVFASLTVINGRETVGMRCS